MEAQGEAPFPAGGGSAILATIGATGAIQSAFHLTLEAGPILVARPLHPQMLQQLWLATCQSACLPISGFMAPTSSFLEAALFAAEGEWTLTSYLESDAARESTLLSLYTVLYRFTQACLPNLQSVSIQQVQVAQLPGASLQPLADLTASVCCGRRSLCWVNVLCSGTSAAQASRLVRMAICCNAAQRQGDLPAQDRPRQRQW